MIPRAYYTFLVVMQIITSIDLKGQSLNPNYNFKHLNVQNGLSQNIVYHFLQDSRGYMWIGTHNGLTLFDGIRTTNFLHNDQDTGSIAGNFINSILEDSSQQIWIGNENGINVYVRKDNSFLHFGIDRPNGTKEKTYCVLLGFVTANELWFLDTKTRSIRSLNIKTQKTSFIAELNASHAIMFKMSQQTFHVWSLYDNGTIHQAYQDSKLVQQQTYFTGKNDSPGFPAMSVIHVLQQNDTTAWLSTNKGLVKLNPVLNKYQLLTKWPNQAVRELRYAAISPKGQLWLASGPDGVYVFDINTSQFIANYRNDKLNPFSICSDNIVSLYFDKTGHVWCGSFGNGSSYSNVENSFFSNHLTKSEMQAWYGNNNIAWLDFDKKENLWFMLQNTQGFWIMDKDYHVKTYKNPRLENGELFNNGMTKLLFDRNNNVWCATNIGLYNYSLETNTMHFIKYDLISEELQGSIWLRDLIELNDGSLLFSTFAGLYRLTNESGKFITKPINFLKPGSFIGFGPLFQDKQNYVYVRTLGELLYVLTPNNNGKEYTLIKTIEFSPLVNQYFADKNDSVIYLATTEGLYHINIKNFQIEKEVLSNKLPFRNVSSFFKKGNLFWIFGDKGLYFFDKKNNTGRLYSIEDGLPSNEFTRSAVVYTPDDRCIVGTSNGIVSFSPGKEQYSSYPPRPQLANIYINDKPDSSIANPDEIESISLSYKQNTFSFDFAPIVFEHASESVFEYKLEEYDDDWIKSGPAHYTRYSKIPPGNYVFNLRVLDAEGKVSPYIKTLRIQIGKAFWQTAIFKVASLALLLLIGWLLLKWYFSYKTRKQKSEFEKQQAVEKERTRIATDMHDDLGAGLSRIKFLSESIRSKKGNEGLIEKDIEKISAYSDEMAEKMGEIVWALNEKNDTIADLVAFTRGYTIEYLAGQNINCICDTPLNLPATFITGEMRQNIFLAVKECLHNIVKHAGASEVRFSIRLSKGIEIIIHDNGKGIDWNAIRPFSNGLQNIRHRMEGIRGKAVFTNQQGTKVTLTVPMNL